MSEKSRGNAVLFFMLILFLLDFLHLQVLAYSFSPPETRVNLAQNATNEIQILVTETSSTETLIRALEYAPYPYQRRNAAIWLGDRNAKEAIPYLLKSLKDPEDVVQSGAAKAIAKIGDKTIFDELIANTKDPNPRVRQYSAYVLGQIAKTAEEKDMQVVEALEAIARDKEDLVRVESTYALFEIGASSSTPLFIEGLGDVEPRVRQYSATALGNVKTDEAAEALVERLEHEANGEVRGMIATALGRHGSSYAVAALLATLPRETEPVRADIALRLADVKTPVTIKALADLMLSDPSPRVRSNAANSLRRIKDPSTIEALTGALKDRAAIVRVPASMALIDLADKSVMDDLINALGDVDSRVANNAADALIRLGELEAVHKLIYLIDSPNRTQADLAIDVLKALTYQDFGSDIVRWKDWYEDTFKSSGEPLENTGSG